MIALMLMRVHSHVNEKYSGVDYYQKKAVVAEYKAKQADIHLALVEHENLVFQQQVAKHMPSLMQQDSYAARNIASVISDNNLNMEKDDNDEKMEGAKEFFTQVNFQSAVEILKSLDTQKEAFLYGPEVTYLLMESYHQLEKHKEATDKIQDMLELYPESHLAGYALIRLGDYYAIENRKSDAKYCYEYAVENFSFDEQVVLDAKMRLGAL